MKRLACILVVLLVAAWSFGAPAATLRVFGLESVKLDRIYDPDARAEHLLLVSGSLKFTGNNVWEAVTYIPQRTAAPRTDRGIYTNASATFFYFYSFLTMSTYTGQLSTDGEYLTVTKMTRDGRQQVEVWYLVR